MKVSSFKNYFTKLEVCIWSCSVLMIISSFLIFDRQNYLNLVTSLIGVTALIFIAKGNPIGQMLCIIFGLIYGIISFKFKYYGEVITYVGMTMPMAVIALISWLKNPFKGNHAEVTINRIKGKEFILIFFLTALVTFIFFFVLRYFNTANLVTSTISIATSFFAVYLTFRRSPFHALGYALNDIVLIVLWVLAAIEDISCICVVVCFSAFLINDVYGFINWTRILKRQADQDSQPVLDKKIPTV